MLAMQQCKYLIFEGQSKIFIVYIQKLRVRNVQHHPYYLYVGVTKRWYTRLPLTGTVFPFGPFLMVQSVSASVTDSSARWARCGFESMPRRSVTCLTMAQFEVLYLLILNSTSFFEIIGSIGQVLHTFFFNFSQKLLFLVILLIYRVIKAIVPP